MDVRINGEDRTLPDGLTVATLLSHLELQETRVAVERNREIVPKMAYATTPIEAGDEIEIVWFVGGGA
jgi:sulfur carrier protein